MAVTSDINALLNDKLFQVIGSTPASIAESLKKVNIQGNTKVGSQLFAVSVFAAAVNKATLETFVADGRFTEVRPIIMAALTIQNRSNMTALTLLGHCFLTTDAANTVVFAQEFRKKMGQNNLWAGELESGSLSEVQKKILKEKKRITNETEAKALGNGFLKYTKLSSGRLEGLEKTYFSTGNDSSIVANQASSGTSQVPSSTFASGVNMRDAPKPVSPPRGEQRRVTPPDTRMGSIAGQTTPSVSMPLEVLEYRRNIIGQSDSDIASSIDSKGLDDFIARTRRMMADDPDGSRMRQASTVGRS